MKAELIFGAALLSSFATTKVYGQGLDFVAQDIAIDVTTDVLAIDVHAQLVAIEEASSLDLLRPIVPITLATIDGVPVPVVPHAEYPDYLLHIDFPAPVAAAAEVEVVLELRGVPDCRSPSTPGAKSCSFARGELVLTPASPSLAWYLLDLYGLDPFELEIEVTAPAGRTIIAGQGAPKSVATSSSGYTRVRFGIVHPNEAFGVYVSAKANVTASGGTPVIGYFDEGEDRRAKMQHAVDLGAQVLDTLDALYTPLGLDEFHVMTVPPGFEFAGLGLLGNVLFGEYVVGELDYLLEQGVAHELSHSWWGGLSSALDPDQSAFFNEAFAEYSAWLALGEIQGPAARVAGNRMNAVWYQYRRPGNADIAILNPNAQRSPAFIFATYHKGSQVLRSLEARVGRDNFLAALRQLITNEYGSTSVAALSTAIATTSGQNLMPELVAWLERPGFPKIHARSTLTADALELTLTSAEGFTLAVPIRVRYTDGSSDERTVLLDAAEKSVLLPLRASFAALELDPDWTGVREFQPNIEGDVSFDGSVDAVDLIEVALRSGTALPTERRRDGGYDPLYDVDADRRVGDADLEAIVAATRF